MAPAQTRRQVNGNVDGSRPSNELSPSTLASHLAPVNWNGQNTFDRRNFDQLLDVALGVDENGKSNLNDDPDVNATLVRIIFQAGVEPFIGDGKENVFSADGAGRASLDLAQCLEVVRRAIDICPRVLYTSPSPENSHPDKDPHTFLTWVLPRVIPFLGLMSTSEHESSSKAEELVALSLAADSRIFTSRRGGAGVGAFLSAWIEDGLARLKDEWQRAGNAFAQAAASRVLTLASLLSILAKSDACLADRRQMLHILNGARIMEMLDDLLRLFCQSCTQPLIDSNYGTKVTSRLSEILSSLLSTSTKQRATGPLHQLNEMWSSFLSQVLVKVKSGDLRSQSVAVLALETTFSMMPISAQFCDAVSENITTVAVDICKMSTLEASGTLKDQLNQLISLSHHEVDSVTATLAQLPIVPKDVFPDGDRPKKRLRLSLDEKDDNIVSEQEKVCQNITQTMSGRPVKSLVGLSQTAKPYFRSLSTDQQVYALEQLGRTACKLYRREALTPAASYAECPVCDRDDAPEPPEDDAQIDPDGELLDTLAGLSTGIQKNNLTRVAGLTAFKRLLLHTKNAAYLNLNKSVSGEWITQSLRSSNRDVRLAAIQALRPFIWTGSSVASRLVHLNRVALLDFLQTLGTREDIRSQETCILTLTAIGRYVGDDELNIILVRLIEYLGHGNPYIKGLVYSELQRLSEALRLPISRLLPPFFRTIGVVVTKHITSRPAIAEEICDLLGWPMDGFLTRIEEFAVPYFVLLKRKDKIERIARAHEPPASPFEICTQPRTIKNIAVLLLTQNFADPEETIMGLLLNVSEDFKEHDLATWLNLESPAIASELLKVIGDAGRGRNSRPLQGLQLLAQMLSRKSSYSSGSRRGDSIITFLETSSLSIVNHSIFALSSEGDRDAIEKRRVLISMGELVRLARGRVVDALPQICACFRSAVDSPQLLDAAFASWVVMMRALNDDDAEPLLDQTLAIIAQYWKALSEQSQQLADQLVSELWNKHGALLQESLAVVPSLAAMPTFARFEADVGAQRHQMDESQLFHVFVLRLRNENLVVVEQALGELEKFAHEKQDYLHEAILKEQPEDFIGDLTRAVLDACLKFKDAPNIAQLCGQCLGHIGCLDPNRIESTSSKKTIVVVNNFQKGDETIDFIVFLLENVLVKSFLSAPSTRAQGFLAWAMQELLKLSNLDEAIALRSRTTGTSSMYRRWLDLPTAVQNVLTPFLNSKYIVQPTPPASKVSYPLFVPGKMTYHQWLRTITLDLLNRAVGDNIRHVTSICCRIINGQDSTIPAFLLPYMVLNLIVSGISEDQNHIIEEILSILREPMEGDAKTQEDIRRCSEMVFEIWDYIFAWAQQKRKQNNSALARSEKGQVDSLVKMGQDQIQSVEFVLKQIPADLVASRALDCKSYARALFHWEEHIKATDVTGDKDQNYMRLQEIYAQIDEPDGVEGIATKIMDANIEQQVLEHRKAGRWTAAQSWYELQLTQAPDNSEAQINLMQCLKESGQFDVLLRHYDSLKQPQSNATLAAFALEAAWTNGHLDKLPEYLRSLGNPGLNFNCNLADILVRLYRHDQTDALGSLVLLSSNEATTLSGASISSLQACHDILLRLHVIQDIQLVITATPETKPRILHTLDRRLDVIGSYVSDKFFALGARRAAMKLSPSFNDLDVASTWLATARLARKFSSSNQAFASVLHASELGEGSATLEQAKLLWRQNHYRKAIQTLESAIESGAFVSHTIDAENGLVTLTVDQKTHQNEVTARAYVLLGKWLDAAGQKNSEVIIRTFRKATDHLRSWEKGWYNLGKYYNKILDSERTKEPGKESQPFITGEATKLVIDCYLRAANCGTKYIFQTLPKVLTLWLELVAGSEQNPDARRGTKEFQAHSAAHRKVIMATTHEQLRKYTKKLRPVVLYTILPQITARMCHGNAQVSDVLEGMIMRVVDAFPLQALWTILATTKSSVKDRQVRGLGIFKKISDLNIKANKKASGTEFRSLVQLGQRFFDELLRVSEFPIEGKMPRVSLAKELGFNHRIAPIRLVVPVESCLIPNLPSNFEASTMKTFTPFAKEPVTISAFLDDAMVLSSLQKPRRLSIRGTDGKVYNVMAKPKDDLRKDQRLMEFNTMINRFLKRDVEASKRRLYIRTYAVVPLNEECGLIEWVENLKTLRDILLKLYKERNITPNYAEIRNQLDEACSGPPEKVSIFEDRILKKFAPRFHIWFRESFPEPTAWFNARLRYTRSAAVMSIVGHTLGLGDRHGENILFEEDNGGTLHVDFNCLFDKGLTFEKPEMVPFRLTHNMVDAMGAYGYEGPFRRCCEITLGLLRANEDSLMTILETFLHDPTTEFIDLERRKKKNQRGAAAGVPDTPTEVLEGVRTKVRGMLAGESVPLSVGGYVEEMIRRAVDPANMCRMYIGWCAFF